MPNNRTVIKYVSRDNGSVRPSRRRLVDAARQLLAADPAWPVFDDLARELGVSRVPGRSR
jgi:hypothetical protein